MSLEGVAGRPYGPFPADTGSPAVARFVSAVGDDPQRWARHVPPAYAAAALFAAAPAFLEDAGASGSLVHTEQAFEWHRPLAHGEPLEVSGLVAAVRTRGPMSLVTFDVTAAGDSGVWLESSSTFLVSAQAVASVPEEGEPPLGERAEVDPPEAEPLPPGGGEPSPMRVSASWAELVRYAAASGDLNPIHWDHDAARAAGLPGVVVHGLLMAAWLASAAGRHAPGVDPLRSMRVRFRRPLRPAAAARVTGSVAARHPSGADLSLAVVAGEDRVATATVRVTA